MNIQNRCTQHQVIMTPDRIHYLRFILEAYEGMALVSTLDRDLGLVLLSIAPGCEEDVLAILESERSELALDPISFPSHGKSAGQNLCTQPRGSKVSCQ